MGYWSYKNVYDAPDTAWIRLGYDIDIARTRILHIKSEVSDVIRHDTLPISKCPCIIECCVAGILDETIMVLRKLFISQLLFFYFVCVVQ